MILGNYSSRYMVHIIWSTIFIIHAPNLSFSNISWPQMHPARSIISATSKKMVIQILASTAFQNPWTLTLAELDIAYTSEWSMLRPFNFNLAYFDLKLKFFNDIISKKIEYTVFGLNRDHPPAWELISGGPLCPLTESRSYQALHCFTLQLRIV